MVRCVDCGFCGFYVDLSRGLQWYEMDMRTRQAFARRVEYNHPGQNPGTGHWNYVRCNKYLQEWAGWAEAVPSMDRLIDALTKERECDGYVGYLAGLTPPERYRIQPHGTQQSVPKGEYDVFLSHSSQDDDLVTDIKQLLEANGIKTFSTPGSIPTGKWEPQIEEALRQSQSIWVLLTPHTLKESVWAHHEYGYFYGYRHGIGVDLEGHSCRFLFTQDTNLRGALSRDSGRPDRIV
ncbi:toll/interleukin-1 receptor domain-containing protein [Chloroflexota bacterium]